MAESGIYKITCLPTGNIYIGSAINVKTRWNAHRHYLRNNHHANAHLQNAWNKYGENAFVFSIMEKIADKTMLCNREQYWIDLLCTNTDFNIAPKAYSSLGRKASLETRKKLSTLRTGSKNHRAKLTEDMVKDIKIRLLNNHKVGGIATDYGVNYSIIDKIKREVSWKHVNVSGYSENILQTYPCGEQHYKTKLNDAKVSEIKMRLAAGEAVKDLSNSFDVTMSVIHGIKYGKNWKHIRHD